MNGKFVKDLPIANILVPNGYTPTDPLDIATKAWVESLFSNTKFNNGLTVTSGVVQLGGTLTKNTFIDGNFNLRIGEATQLNILSLRASSLRLNNMIWPSADGTSGQILRTNGSNTLSWITPTFSPAGSSTQIQFNNNGNLSASSNFAYLFNSRILTIGTNQTSNSSIALFGSPAGDGFLQCYGINRAQSNQMIYGGEKTQKRGSELKGLIISSVISDTSVDRDSGVIPLAKFEFAKVNSSFTLTGAIVNRPLLEFYNHTTLFTRVTANGNWNYQDNELTNIGGLTVGASFPTTDQPVGTLWNDAGTIKMGTL